MSPSSASMRARTRGWWWIAAGAIVLVAAVLGWHYRSRPTAVAPVVADIVAPTAGVSAPEPLVPAEPPPAPTPREQARFDRAAQEAAHLAQVDAVMRKLAQNIPLSEEIAQAQAGADLGDPEAMAKLGTLLQRCVSSVRDPSESKLIAEFERDQATDIAPVEEATRARRRGRELEHARDLARHRDCTAAGAERVEDFHVWLERAARAGSIKAMQLYAEFALTSFRTNGELMANLDEVLRRRDLARSFGLAAVAGGDAYALSIVASGHAWLPDDGGNVHGTPSLGTTGLYPSNPVAAQSYWYTSALVMAGHFGVEREGTFETLWRGSARPAHEQMSDAEWQAMQAAGRERYLRYFTGPRTDG